MTAIFHVAVKQQLVYLYAKLLKCKFNFIEVWSLNYTTT
jgi:hypothetical protein